MHQSGPDDLQALSRFASGLDIRALDEEVRDSVKACLLYGLAVGIATRHVPAARAVCLAIDSDGGGRGDATRLLDGAVATAGEAALANGVLLSGRVQGDSHPAGHIGGVVIPAALAIAQRRALSGAEFLSALVAGYEVALRIGRDHAAALSDRGFRTTPCYGVFGAAVVGARALRLPAAATRNALALAANLAAGLREHVHAGTEESPYHAGFAARNGLNAAALAAQGLTSAAPTALHGEAGFFSAYGGAGSDHGSRLCEALGERFEFTGVTYKPYPACQFLRAMIQGLAALSASAGGTPAEAIEVRLNPFEADFIGVRYMGPFTNAAQTVMSAPFCAALAWTTGTTGYAALREFDNAAVLALLRRVTIIDDPAIARYETRLRVRLADGRALERHEAGGGGSFRLDWDAALRSARALGDEVGVAPALITRLTETVLAAEDLPEVAPLIRAVRDAMQSGAAS